MAGPSRSRFTSADLSPLAAITPLATEDVIGPLTELERLHAPHELFIAGDRSLLRRPRKVSIVGSRNASEDGLRRAMRLARILVEHDVTVVSGLARGIDTVAHRAAMDAGGRTIGVIGTPLNRAYPPENAPLQAEIAARQVLVSQFAPGVKTQRHHFPIRNRTMALLVDASVIVEAGDTSGSLSQGWEALRLGRTLFIMKSLLERTDLEWPAKMLHYGAAVLDDPEALLDELPTGDLTAVPF